MCAIHSPEESWSRSTSSWSLTIESFAPHVGTSFWLHAEDRKIELRLTRAARVMDRLTHDGFAEPLDIFLVPVARDTGG